MRTSATMSARVREWGVRGCRRKSQAIPCSGPRRSLVAIAGGQALVAGVVATVSSGRWDAFWLVGAPSLLLSFWFCAEWRRAAYLQFRCNPRRFERAGDPESYLGIAFGLIWLAGGAGLALRFLG